MAFTLTAHLEVVDVAIEAGHRLAPTEVGQVGDAFAAALRQIETTHERQWGIISRLDELGVYGIAEIVWRIQTVLESFLAGAEAANVLGGLKAPVKQISSPRLAGCIRR